MNFDDSAIDSLIERIWADNIDEYHLKALEEWGHPLAKLKDPQAVFDTSDIPNTNSCLKVSHISCDTCRQDFKDYATLFRHKNRVHQCDQPCPYCRQSINSFDDFLDHLNRSHNVPYKCPVCSATFEERRLLEAHYDLTHGDGVVKFCFRCGKLFSTPQSYHKHCQSVHKEPNSVPELTCKKCNKSFKTVQALKLHKTRIHGTR